MPTAVPVAVRSVGVPGRARPKSASLARPGASRTFPGLTSRWTKPRSWSAWSPSATLTAIRTDSSGAIDPAEAIRSASEPPSHSSMTRKGSPSDEASPAATS
ncbi:MAG: hypothetical protein A2X23_03855 [Chloroflexi bacterium GWC2_73_18]|nr:MAG: hypothetical protein A2X23_03855 [Chloroflexi bacterium GWC2_73_18]